MSSGHRVLPRYALLVRNAASAPLGEAAAQPPRSHPISLRATLIGSAAHAHIRLEDPFVSGEHARLLLRDTDLHLDDLKSTNRTLVNGSPITTRIAVRPGDVLQFADVVCRVESLVGPVAQEPNPEPLREEAPPAAVDAAPEPIRLPAVHRAGPLAGEPLRFRLQVLLWFALAVVLAVLLFR